MIKSIPLSIYSLLFVFFLLLPSEYAFSQNAKIHVLFIGNSLTYVNNLPGLVVDLAKSRHWGMDYDMYAPGGYRFSQHAGDPQLLNKINEGTWDWVILQEQSQMLEFPASQLQQEVFPYAAKLCELIRGANPQARIAFYETMATQNGDQMNAKEFPELGTYEGTQEKINTNYTLMTQQNQGTIAPVGLVWQNVRSGDHSIELYADEKHPNLTGTYLAACVFYAVIFEDSAVGLPHPSQIDDPTAYYLQTITDKIVFKKS